MWWSGKKCNLKLVVESPELVLFKLHEDGEKGEKLIANFLPQLFKKGREENIRAQELVDAQEGY